MRLKIKHVKIAVSVLISLMLVFFLTKNVFLADSPQVNPVFIANLQRLPYALPVVSNIALALEKSPAEKLRNVPLNQISKGVYAKSDENNSYTEINVNEVEWVEYVFNIRGEEVKLRIPKGDIPPSLDVLEKLD